MKKDLTLEMAVNRVASAITSTTAAAGSDVHGGHVECLTEAVMGISKSLQAIADAIERLAQEVCEVYEEVVRRAAEAGLVVNAYGGVATLAIPREQRRAEGVREQVLAAIERSDNP